MLLSFSSCSSEKNMDARSRVSFNDDWKFYHGDISKAKEPGFDDSKWRKLNLPHDWAIEGEFSADNPSGTGGGALPGGIGWYRKTFRMNSGDNSEKLFVDFDGVFMNSDVYLNGVLLGNRPFGYISFRYDMTPHIKWNEENVIAVRVDNQDQPNSRWYSGCGIYRNVWITKTAPAYVDLWGTYISTPHVSKDNATLSIATTVKNEYAKAEEIELISILLNENGEEVTRVSSSQTIDMDKSFVFNQTINVENPDLWCIENPYLYNVRSEVHVNGMLVDNYNTTTGIRSFQFDAKEGFFLNAKPFKINGVCMHHDLGALGAAVNTRAIERQLEILKEMGCNGIRTSHNPPAPELLQLSDKMGFIVMNETFDMWRKKKTKHDYSRYFPEWYEKDLTDILLRDRNHPSIFMWCIGNEVLEQWSDASADTLSLEEANMILNFGQDNSMLAKDGEVSVNSMLCTRLAEIVKEYDKTRPVTAGCNEPNPRNHLFKSGALDIIGFNYHDDHFAKVPENFPKQPFIITESVSALQTRGYYRMPSNEYFIWPERWDKPFFESSFSCSAYDNCHVPWGSTHESSLAHVKNNKFISGQYVWTGFDYLGEPTPFGWPARSSYFGIVDLAGFPKDVYYLYQSEWTDKNVLHLFPHWNWKKGQDIDMWAYYGQADEVELFVNGESKGKRIKGSDEFKVVWNVKYEPGTVKAVSRKDGKVIAEKELKTAGEPYKIRLTGDRKKINADNKDLNFVTVEVLDKDGNICPNADNLINFNVQGAGFIAGVDNGSPTSLESFKAPYRKAFNGKCLVILQNNGKKGKINLKATAENLKSANLTFETY